MTLGEIIRDYRESHNMSMDAFSARSGISKAYISLLEKNQHPKTGKPIAPSIKCIRQAATGMGMDFDVLFARLDGDVSLEDQPDTMIPVLGRVAAGIPIDMVNDIIGYEEISESLARTGEFFALKIKGDSMTPQICDGDTVIVRQQSDAESNEIVIAAVNGDEAVCKRLLKINGALQLISNNPSYEPMLFTPEEVDETPVTILGKVIELRRKI